MSVYLIDYENVNFAGLEGVGNLTPEDEVIIFYSNAASTIPMNLHIDVQKSGARMQYIRIERTGKNYLDFQLSALSGYLVGTTDQTDFVVISRDTGYDSVLDLWNNQTFVGRTLTFRRQDSIGGNIPVKPRRKRGKKAAAETEAPAQAEKKAEKTSSGTGTGKKAPAQAEKKAEKTSSGTGTGKKASAQAEKKAEKTSSGTGTGKKASAQAEKKKTTSAKPKNAAAKNAAKAAAEKQSVKEAKETAGTKPAEKEAEEFAVIAISASEKKNIRSAVKELTLKPTDYTKIYRTFEKTPDKQAYNTGLIRAFKNQELGNRIYKATLPVFNARHR